MPEAKDSIQSIAHSKSFMFVVYSNGIVGRLVKYTLDTGKATEVKLPASGTVDINCPGFPHRPMHRLHDVVDSTDNAL